jgi:hypothetical protein
MDELQLDEERPACTECGATCTVETLAVAGHGVRLLLACPAGHGPQILLDPFEGHR